MDIVCLLFDGITALDIVGPYEVLQRLPEAEVKFVADVGGRGPHRQQVPRARRRLLVRRGHERGRARRARRLRDACARDTTTRCSSGSARSTPTTTWTTSVCTGSMLLAAAGLLEGKEATTHWASLERLEGVRRDPDRPASRRAGQDRDRGRSVVGHRHGAHARGAHRGRRVRAGHSARHRVRPAAAVRRGSLDKAPARRRRVHDRAVRSARSLTCGVIGGLARMRR